MKRRALTHIEVIQLGNLLVELSKDPDFHKIGYELLTQEVNMRLKPADPIVLRSVKSLVLDLELNDYFASRPGPGSRVRQADETAQRLQKLEAELAAVKERLSICEKKWLEHIVPKHKDDEDEPKSWKNPNAFSNLS